MTIFLKYNTLLDNHKKKLFLIQTFSTSSNIWFYTIYTIYTIYNK